jgi:prenyltransferase beta subunit
MIATLRAQPLRLLALVVLLAAVSLTAAAPALRAAETGSDSVNQALAWLRTQQLSNGGFAAFGGESDPGTTADAVFAFAAAGIQPQSVSSVDGASAIDYLIANAQAASGDPGLSGKAE